MKENGFKNIDEYIKTFPEDVQSILEKIRSIVREEAPEATEAMSYQMPTFQINKKNLVHFAAYESHIGFYPTPSGITAFMDKISKYKNAKGSVQFPIESVPYDLIREIVKFRVSEFKKQI